jgi:replicative DNA helicase
MSVTDPGIGETAAEILVRVLHHCLKDRKYLQDVLTILEPEDLPDSDLLWVYRQVVTVWTKHREVTPRIVLERRAKRAKKAADERLELIARIYDDEEDYPLLAFDELHQWLRTRRLHLALVEATEAIETDTDHAYEAISRVAIQDSKPKGIEIVDWFRDLDERQREREDSKDDPLKTIPIGIPRIDEALDGGIARREVALVLGTTGRGKSMFLVNSGYRAAGLGFQTTHLTLEMSAFQTATRYDARWSRLDARRFKKFDFTPDQLELLAAKKARASDKFNGRLQIVGVPVNAADVNTVRAVLDDLIDRGLPPTDLLILDSADHMRSLRNFEAFRHEQSAIYWGVKSIAQEYNLAVISSTHASKEWADKLIKAEGAAESYDKSRIADIVISLNKSKVEGREDVRRYVDVFLAKYRDGEDGIIVPTEVHRSTMTFEEIGSEEREGDERD